MARAGIVGTSLLDYARQAARAALKQQSITYGPWAGSMRSRPATEVPREYISGGSNFLYLPRYGRWKRRGGQVQKFDTFGASAGLLPAKWTSKARWMEEFSNPGLFTGGVPTVLALLTRETIASGLDDGRFSTLYWRDQVANVNHTFGDDYSATTYPVPGSTQTYRVIPLWYASGDGGLTRGVDEFKRRFFFGGSRRFLKVGRWTYLPSVLGTPSRWDGSSVEVTTSPSLVANSDLASYNGGWGLYNNSGAPPATYTAALAAEDQFNAYTARDNPFGGATGYGFRVALNATLSTSVNVWTIKYWACRAVGTFGGSAPTLTFRLVRSDGNEEDSPIIDVSGLGTSWAEYTTTVTFVGTPDAQTANSLRIDANFVAASVGYVCLGYVTVQAGSGGTASVVGTRLIPSGPLPPTHAGTLAKGTLVASGTTTTMLPDADTAVGSWTEVGPDATLFAAIDDSPVADDSNYITGAGGGALCRISLSNPGFVPAATDTVTIYYRAQRASAISLCSLLVELTQATTAQAAFSVTALNTAWTVYTLTLTPAQIAAITAGAGGWNDLYLRFTATGAGNARVSQAFQNITPSAGATAGGWRGSDRYFYSVAVRFEDDSVWAVCTPRFPNAILADGYNLFTVDAANPTNTYDKVTWSNLPICWHGVKSRILLRTPKIDSTTSDNLQLNPYDLRVVAEIQDNTTTTYDDYFAEDESLTLDVAKAFIRFDHMMPPASRYIFGGDLRVCHSYGRQNPCAIILAPIGRTADYDLNLPDTSVSAYTQNSSYMRLSLDYASNNILTLTQHNGSAFPGTFNIDLNTYNTLQKVVDRINSTSVARDTVQWRAQLCPNVNPEASSVNTLTPHQRTITAIATVTGSNEVNRAAGGLAKVAVGAVWSNSGAPAFAAGTYVLRIDSDTKLIMSSNALTTASNDVVFYFDLGDSPGALNGYQRVIANSLPGFLYFNESYLDDVPVDKQAVWMTVASPGQVKSAANSFSGRIANKHSPPLDAGISMGGAAVDQGFVVPFANKVGAIRNMRDTGSGLDEDYRLQIFGESGGCKAPGTVVAGNRVAFYLKIDGMYAADLFRELKLSDDIYVHAPALLGDWSYELPLCDAATAMDTDGAYAHARVMRGALWVNYRAPTGSPTRPDRQVCFDFSSGTEASGLEGLLREGMPNGWSVPLVRSVTAMVEARRSDGIHLYGWNDENAGSTGDGRIDEIETTDTDNGVAIVGSVETPWERLDLVTQISAQEVTVEHSAPVGSTGFLDFVRSYLSATFNLALSTSDTLPVLREVKQLPQAARVGSAACYLGYRQTAGGARELKRLTLRAKALPSFK